MTHTTDINRIFMAGLTTRWHTNPHLAQSCDRIDGHQGRVARLAIAIWPDASRDLIVAAQANKNLQDAEQHGADLFAAE